MFTTRNQEPNQTIDDMKLEEVYFNSFLLQHIAEKVFASNVIPSYNFDYWSMNETDRYTMIIKVFFL